jgi:predicted O-methyltransferase YrrM
MNEWLDKYRISMDSRQISFNIALDLLYQLDRHNIVETGCVREPNDWGAGNSTLLFGEFCELHGGKIISVDNVPRHLAIAKKLTSQYSRHITFVESDSVSFLTSYTETIDLLYLDSMDVPIGEEDDRKPCQEHCLKEFMAAEPRLHPNSIVLIDDYFGGDGKGKLAESYMMANGWRRIIARQQQLFVR